MFTVINKMIKNQRINELGLVDHFRAEYKKDYEWARKSGQNINSKYVSDFLKYR